MNDAPREVEETVRAYFTAVDGEVRSTGLLRRLDDALQGVDQPDAWRRSDQVTLERVAVERIDGEEAVVALEGVRRLTFDHPQLGEVVAVSSLNGPLRALRLEDRWRVADYTVNGKLVSEATLEPDGDAQHGGLTVRVLAFISVPRASRLLLEVRTDGASDVQMIELFRGLRVLGFIWRYTRVPIRSSRARANGEAGIVDADWRETLPPRASELRLLIRAAETSASKRFLVPFAVGLSAPSRVRRLSHLPFAAVPERLRNRLYLAPPAGFIACVWLGYTRAGGALLAASSALILAGAAHGVIRLRRTWPGLLRGVVGVGVMGAFGLYLALGGA